MKQLGVALIGCGSISHVHMAALKEIDLVNICGVWAARPELRLEFADKHSVSVYESYEEVLDDPQVNTVIITLPPGIHVDYGVKAAAAGKNVVLEKPMDINVAKCRALIDSCHQNGVKLAVIYQNRFTKAAQTVKRALEQELLGKVFLADAYVKWYRSPEYYTSNAWRGTWDLEGGGALINQAIHTIDLVQWFMGGAKQVTGIIRTVTHQIETEDLGIALVEYNNGAIGVIEGSTAVVPGFKERVELHGTKGTIILEGGNIKEWKVAGCEEGDYVAKQKVIYGDTNSPALTNDNHLAQLREIFQAFSVGKEPMVNGEEGLKSLEIVRAVYDSSANGGRIKL